MIVRFSGFGGQGIVLSGYINGSAAVKDGKRVLQTQSYGSESRGGGCRSDVFVSDEEIHELAPTRLDVLVAMSQRAFDTYIHDLAPEGILLVEEDLVEPSGPATGRTFGIGATEIAYKKFGRKIMANMVMLGFTGAVVKAVSRPSLEAAVRENAPPGTEEKNLAALAEGWRLGERVHE